MTIVSGVVVFGLLIATFGFVLAVLRRVLAAAEREVSVSVRVPLWRIEIKVREGGESPRPRRVHRASSQG